MDVVRHHAPSKKVVPLTVEMLNSISDNARDGGIEHPALTYAFVQSEFQLAAKVPQAVVLGIGKIPMNLLRGADYVHTFETGFLSQRNGQRVLKSKRHEVSRTVGGPVREPAMAAFDDLHAAGMIRMRAGNRVCEMDILVGTNSANGKAR